MSKRTRRTQYRTVDTSTLAGLKTAERLHRNGWKIAQCGLFLIWFYRVPDSTEVSR